MYVSEGTRYSVFLVKIVSNPTTPFHRRYSRVSGGTCKVPGHFSGIYAVKVLFPLNKYGFHFFFLIKKSEEARSFKTCFVKRVCAIHTKD